MRIFIIAICFVLAGCANTYKPTKYTPEEVREKMRGPIDVRRVSFELIDAPELIEQAERLTTDALLDPTSAMFRNTIATRTSYESGRTTNTVCGSVNGKNAYGGYAGFDLFYVNDVDGVVFYDNAPFVGSFDNYCSTEGWMTN